VVDSKNSVQNIDESNDSLQYCDGIVFVEVPVSGLYLVNYVKNRF